MIAQSNYQILHPLFISLSLPWTSSAPTRN